MLEGGNREHIINENTGLGFGDLLIKDNDPAVLDGQIRLFEDVEPFLEIDDGGDFTPEIDDALHVGGGVGELGDGGVLHHFPHIEQVHCIVLFSEQELNNLEFS